MLLINNINLHQEEFGNGRVDKNCAKSRNLNNSTLNQMSHIQSFLTKHWPQYYLEALKNGIGKDQFIDLSSQFNIFNLTFDLMLIAKADLHTEDTKWLQQLIHRHLLIEYESLKNVQLPKCSSDGEIVSLMKGSIQYVFVQMIQILLRLMSSYLVCCQCQYLNNTILKNISQISYIYPALKIELMAFPDIHLPNWFEKYLAVLANMKNNHHFSLFLAKLKEECLFNGPMEKIINKLIGIKKKESQNNLKTVSIDVQTKKIDVSSNDSENEYEKQKQKEDSTHKKFSELQMFRKKKKKIFKIASDLNNSTPIKQRNLFKNTPKTEKTEDLKRFNNSKSPSKKTPLFKKIKKHKRPLQRTLYYGQTKKFMPKNNANSDMFIENFTSSSSLIFDQTIFFDSNIKTEKNFSKNDTQGNDLKGFFVPQTPRPEVGKKIKVEKRTYSMDLFRNSTSTGSKG